jgi:RNA polymerase sigma-70 factor (ECF subfamily)
VIFLEQLSVLGDHPSYVAAIARPRQEVPTDSEVVAAILAGDEHAFTLLYRRHARSIAGVVFRLLGNSSELDDVMQETMLEILRSLPRLQDPERVRGFMSTIAARIVYRKLRTQTRRREIHELLEAVQPSPLDTHERERIQGLYRALWQLSEDQRVPWMLTSIEGMTLDEAASACGCSQSTVRRRIAEAQRKLDRRLGHA